MNKPMEDTSTLKESENASAGVVEELKRVAEQNGGLREGEKVIGGRA